MNEEVFKAFIPPLMSILDVTICSILLERGVSIFRMEKYSWKRAVAIFCVSSALPPLFKRFFIIGL